MLNYKNTLMLLSLAIVGCGPVPIEFNAQETDPETGIQVEYRTDVDFPLQSIAEAYKETEVCMGMTARPGPKVLIVADAAAFTGLPGIYGMTYFDQGLVLVNDLGLRNNNTILLHHEFVHYILSKNGMPNSENEVHQSYLFFWCGGRIYGFMDQTQ